MSKSKSEAEAIAPPKAGDMVYFYFLHAFCEPDGPPGHPGAFTGKMEMRCRPARVVAVVRMESQFVVGAGFEMLANIELRLEVEFSDDDRVRIPGGVGGRLRRVLPNVRSHHGPDGPGSLGRAWPEHMTWAFQEMPQG